VCVISETIYQKETRMRDIFSLPEWWILGTKISTCLANLKFRWKYSKWAYEIIELLYKSIIIYVFVFHVIDKLQTISSRDIFEFILQIS